MSVNISNESEDSFHNIITAVPPHRRKHILTKLKESPIYDEADLYAVCRGKTNSEMTSFLQRVLELDEINASVLAGVIIHPYEQPSRPSTAPDRPLANPQSPLHHHNMHSSHLKRLIKSTELKTYSFRFQVCQRGMRSVLKHKAMEYGFGGWVRRISATCIQSLVVFPDHAPFESTIIPFMRWLRLVDGYTPLDDDFKHSAQYVEYLRRGFIVYRIPHHVEAQLMRDHEYYSEDPDGAESIHSGNADISLMHSEGADGTYH
mmetsp:Transcript_2528/g.3879  ORF Transcript_2528/g.3879 Transcript_2528/m.3879 type:complete len:261 (+) Transcript_2528:73-855(+)